MVMMIMKEKLPPLPKDRAPLYHQRMKTPPINNEGTHILAKILIVMVAIPVVCLVAVLLLRHINDLMGLF